MDKKIKWNELYPELQNYFMIRYICVVLGIVFVIIFMFWTKLYKPGLFLLGACILYLCYVAYIYYMCITQKLYVFEGICESLSLKKKDINILSKKNPMFSIYGNSSLTMVIDDKKFIVPISYNFSGEEGNTIRVFVLKGDVYEKTENAYLINNPLLVKIIKI